MYLYVTRMSLVCIHMSFVCHLYVLAYQSYVNGMSLTCTGMLVVYVFTINLEKVVTFLHDTGYFLSIDPGGIHQAYD